MYNKAYQEFMLCPKCGRTLTLKHTLYIDWGTTYVNACDRCATWEDIEKYDTLSVRDLVEQGECFSIDHKIDDIKGGAY